MSSSLDRRIALRQGAFYLAVAAALGIIAAHATQAKPFVFAGALAVCVVSGLAAALAGRRAAASSCVTLAFAFLGGYSASLHLDVSPDSIAAILGSPRAISFRGVVTDDGRSAVREGESRRYLVDLSAVEGRAGFVKASGRVVLYTPAEIPWGAEVIGKARMWRSDPPRNPGQFDYAAYLRGGGVDGVASAPSPGLITVIHLGGGGRISREIAALRRAFAERLDALGLSPAGVVPAVILGDRAGLSSETREAFKRSGTMHLLAISGLHLGVVVGFFWWLLRVLGASSRSASVVAIAAAVLYALLAGARPSVVRAALMATIGCVAVISSRRALVLSVVSTAALVMLLFRPLDLFDAGFEMSFSAVLALFYLGGPLSRWFSSFVPAETLGARRLVRRLLSAFGWSLGAWLGVTPLVAWYFGMIAVISPIANLVLIPVASVMVIAGFLASLASLVSMSAAHVFALSALGAEATLTEAARLLGAVPGAYLYCGAFPVGVLVLVCGFFSLSAFLAAAGRRVAPLVAAGLVAANVVVWIAAFSAPGAASVETVVDGDGSAAVIFDGGGRTIIFVGHDADEDFAEYVICPFLVSRGRPKVDILVESAGADARVRSRMAVQLPVGMVLRQRRFRGSKADASDAFDYIDAGDSVELTGGVTLRFHSGRSGDFAKSRAAYHEGLVVEVGMPDGRAVVAVDASDGCIAAVDDRIDERPDALVFVGRTGGACAERWAKALSPTFEASADPDNDEARSTRITLGAEARITTFAP